MPPSLLATGIRNQCEDAISQTMHCKERTSLWVAISGRAEVSCGSVGGATCPWHLFFFPFGGSTIQRYAGIPTGVHVEGSNYEGEHEGSLLI